MKGQDYESVSAVCREVRMKISKLRAQRVSQRSAPAGMPFLLVLVAALAQNLCAQSTPPTITSITNAASFVPARDCCGSGVVPGGIVSIFGTNLSNVSGIVMADKTPLPTELRGTRVEFTNVGTRGDSQGGLILAVANNNGQEQINVQVPYSILGLGCYVSAPDGCGVSVVVFNNGVRSEPVVVNSPIASPGIFTIDGTTGVIAHSLTNQLVTAGAPGDSGEVVSIYATGLGPIFPGPADGEPAPADPPIKGPVSAVSIGGLNAKVLRSILAPGLVGVNQVDVQIPASVSSGSVDVYIGAMGFICITPGIDPETCSLWTSKPVKMWVR